MLAGATLTSGDVKVSGFLPRKREVAFLKSITLVMGQKQQLLWDLPPADTFALRTVGPSTISAKLQFEETVEELTRLLGLADLVTKPTRQLSLGASG